jgi:hypothetical protein
MTSAVVIAFNVLAFLVTVPIGMVAALCRAIAVFL